VTLKLCSRVHFERRSVLFKRLAIFSTHSGDALEGSNNQPRAGKGPAAGCPLVGSAQRWAAVL